MDYREFYNGLLSLSSILALFSATFLFSSIILKPYLALEPNDRDIIIFINIFNIIFSIYWLIEGLHFKVIFKLEEKNIIKFGKRIGIVTLIYLPNFILFCSLFFKELHNLLILMLFLILIIKLLLLGIIFKEVFDLVFKKPSNRRFEIEQNRKLYLN
jgi:hypothetical protein